MSQPPSARWRRLLRAWVPWAVAALVLAYVFADVPARTLLDALARVSPWRFALVLLVITAGPLLADALTISLALAATARAGHAGGRDGVSDRVSDRTLAAGLPVDGAAPAASSHGRAPAAPRYRDLLLVRCASALLSLVNYGAGQGGVVYFLHRRHGVALEVGAGAILLATAAFMAVLALAAGLGLLAGAVPDRPELRAVAWAALAALPAYVLLAALRPRFLVRRKLLRYLLAVPHLQLGHAHAALRANASALAAYRKALELDIRLESDTRLRTNLKLMSDDKGAASSVDAAALMYEQLGDQEVADRILAWASEAQEPQVRHRAVEVAEALGMGERIDWARSLSLDLLQEKSCEARRKVVARLRALSDPRAIPELRKAASRTRNRCLSQDANEAITYLESLARDAGTPPKG